jgi:dynein intermediate chain 1
MTEPPPRATFSATATQWAMYDAYSAEVARQEALKSKKKTTDAVSRPDARVFQSYTLV